MNSKSHHYMYKHHALSYLVHNAIFACYSHGLSSTLNKFWNRFIFVASWPNLKNFGVEVYFTSLRQLINFMLHDANIMSAFGQVLSEYTEYTRWIFGWFVLSTVMSSNRWLCINASNIHQYHSDASVTMLKTSNSCIIQSWNVSTESKKWMWNV